MIVQCLNLTSQILELPAETTIETFTSIDPQNISKGNSSQVKTERCTHETREVLEHVEAMFRQAWKDCANKEQTGQLADFLICYQAVFVKMIRMLKGLSSCTIAFPHWRAPVSFDNLHIDSDYRRPKTHSTRCKICW